VNYNAVTFLHCVCCTIALSYYDRSEFLGLAGMVTLNNSETDGFNRIPTLDVAQVVTQDANDGGKRFLPQKMTWLHAIFSNRYIFLSLVTRLSILDNLLLLLLL